MIRIAIVEDEPESREQLIRYLRRYEDENDVKFQVTEYKDGLDILDEYGGQFDLILLDIRMKFVDGMETARKIREKDRNVIIVFITNMAQYAIQGYDVEARGFILKPVRYSAFLSRSRGCAGNWKAGKISISIYSSQAECGQYD